MREIAGVLVGVGGDEERTQLDALHPQLLGQLATRRLLDVLAGRHDPAGAAVVHAGIDVLGLGAAVHVDPPGAVPDHHARRPVQ
jgi:hypothetical protein